MRQLKICLLAAASFISVINGKLSFGLCSSEATQLSFDDYMENKWGNSPLPPFPATGHRITCMDSQFKDLLEIGKGLGFQTPFDLNCGDLAEVSPFAEMG